MLKKLQVIQSDGLFFLAEVTSRGERDIAELSAEETATALTSVGLLSRRLLFRVRVILLRRLCHPCFALTPTFVHVCRRQGLC